MPLSILSPGEEPCTAKHCSSKTQTQPGHPPAWRLAAHRHAAPPRMPKAAISPPPPPLTPADRPVPTLACTPTHTHSLLHLSLAASALLAHVSRGMWSPHSTRLVSVSSSEKWKPLLAVPQPLGTEGSLCEGDRSSWLAQNFPV